MVTCLRTRAVSDCCRFCQSHSTFMCICAQLEAQTGACRAVKGSLHLQPLDDVAAVDVIGYGVAPCVGVRGDEVPLLTDDA